MTNRIQLRIDGIGVSDVVLASDYEVLQARLAEAQNELEAERRQRHFTAGEIEKVVRAYKARLAEAERDMDQLIGERDHAEEMADKLADAIATLLGVEIGEHSSMNCPWEQALEAFDGRAASTTQRGAR